MIWLVLAISPVGKPRVRFPAIVTVCTPPHPAATAIVEASVRAQGAAAACLYCKVPVWFQLPLIVSLAVIVLGKLTTVAPVVGLTVT